MTQHGKPPFHSEYPGYQPLMLALCPLEGLMTFCPLPECMVFWWCRKGTNQPMLPKKVNKQKQCFVKRRIKSPTVSSVHEYTCLTVWESRDKVENNQTSQKGFVPCSLALCNKGVKIHSLPTSWIAGIWVVAPTLRCCVFLVDLDSPKWRKGFPVGFPSSNMGANKPKQTSRPF